MNCQNRGQKGQKSRLYRWGAAGLCVVAIAFLAIPHTQSDVKEYVTLSLGVAVITPTTDKHPEDLIAKADEALYNAKRQGRDRAIGFTEKTGLL